VVTTTGAVSKVDATLEEEALELLFGEAYPGFPSARLHG
jgi:hypothetical protein